MEMSRTLTERELMVEHRWCVCAATHTFLYKIEVYMMSISIMSTLSESQSTGTKREQTLPLQFFSLDLQGLDIAEIWKSSV